MYNKTTNKVEMTIVGDEEVTFGDDLCGALGLAHGAHAQRQITSLTVQHVLWAELPVCVHKPGQGKDGWGKSNPFVEGDTSVWQLG